MCSTPSVAPPAPPPMAPPVLEQMAPKSASNTNEQSRKRQGLSRYKIDAPGKPAKTKLGGIPMKTGV